LKRENAREDALREEILGKEVRFQGKIIRVENWSVRLPDGNPAQREVVVHPGAAAAVAVDERGMVTLVRQHRPAVGKLMLEIPAGKLDFPQEDPLVCAQRELLEETGLSAGRWRPLTNLYSTPGFCNECIALYLATELTEGEAKPGSDEFLYTERMRLKEAVDRVLAGELRDGKTALGLLMASRVMGDTI